MNTFSTFSYTKNDLALMPSRPQKSNKSAFGRVLCICGSFTDGGLCMSGAAELAAYSALRTGAGLVKIFTHVENYSPVSARLPEAVMLLYGDSIDETLLATEVRAADAVLVGCGLGAGEVSRQILKVVLENAISPLVIDADGLNILAQESSLWRLLLTEQRKQTIITPHMGEMSRLTGIPIKEILASPVDIAKDFSQRHNVITLLKDHKTVVTDGYTVYINHSGNSGMSTAGSGDVLSGILVGMLGNRTLVAKTTLGKVAVGAYLHGCAGDLAAEEYGDFLIASDIANSIHRVILSSRDR